jgi:hypothetical protein
METLTDNDLVQMIKITRGERGILDLEIRRLRIQAEELDSRLRTLSDMRDERIKETMKPETAVASSVATQFGVSRAWVWKLAHKCHP